MGFFIKIFLSIAIMVICIFSFIQLRRDYKNQKKLLKKIEEMKQKNEIKDSSISEELEDISKTNKNEELETTAELSAEEKNEIIYGVGNATKPNPNKKIIVAHICNDNGVWENEFEVALSKKWPLPEEAYKKWYEKQLNFLLGETQFIQVENNVIIANMLAKTGSKNPFNKFPLKYEALEECLYKVAEKAKEEKCEVQFPKVEINTESSDWNKIKEIIEKTLINYGIRVVIVDMKKNNKGKIK